jgi:hypothetical protein
MNTFSNMITETFHVVSCYTCGVRFGIESKLYRRVVTDAKGSVYCPACGHSTAWRESEDKKKIKELENKLRWEAEHSERLRQRRDELDASLKATRGVVTRLKYRTAAGVCPCCNRTFSQLARHMAHKHPDFKSA